MVRAPCCEKMGLKKGPWTADEDQVLIKFISLYGHGNWRALPKQAGLLRCGKSCRLRWINYLRPDIKRGNFTREEEDTIINLHQQLGNRWSAIAARLPGRTDNEIKNVWHTHLKKRLRKKEQPQQDTTMMSQAEEKKPHTQPVTNNVTRGDHSSARTCYHVPPSPQPSSSTEDISSSSNNDKLLAYSGSAASFYNNEFPEMDESFWSEVLSEGDKAASSDFTSCPLSGYGMGESEGFVLGGDDNGMEFWYEMFNGSGEYFVPEML